MQREHLSSWLDHAQTCSCWLELQHGCPRMRLIWSWLRGASCTVAGLRLVLARRRRCRRGAHGRQRRRQVRPRRHVRSKRPRAPHALLRLLKDVTTSTANACTELCLPQFGHLAYLCQMLAQ